MIRRLLPGTITRCAIAWLILLIPAMTVLTASVAAAAPPPITEFETPTSPSGPWTVTAGPDGNVWFTEFQANKIGRITPSGTITEFVPPTANSSPFGITMGPDGNLWFAELFGNNIGRVTPDGVTFTEFPVPTAASQPRVIVTGPDGNLWFCENAGNKIGRITTAGIITEFPIGAGSTNLNEITVGPDGNLWFIEESDTSTNRIGRITTGGVVTEFTVPTTASGGSSITAGPDGNLWFTEFRRQPDRANHAHRGFHRIPRSRDAGHATEQHRRGSGRQPLFHRGYRQPHRSDHAGRRRRPVPPAYPQHLGGRNRRGPRWQSVVRRLSQQLDRAGEPRQSGDSRADHHDATGEPGDSLRPGSDSERDGVWHGDPVQLPVVHRGQRGDNEPDRRGDREQLYDTRPDGHDQLLGAGLERRRHR